MAGTPLVSVCIVTGRRAALLDACLVSLLAQRDAPEFEVLVCSDGDAGVAGTVHRRFPNARVCHVDRALPGAARNLLVRRARGDVLLFLDDDVTVDPSMLAHLARLAAAYPRVGVFGGPNESPPSSTRFQFVQGAVLASIVGSGPVRRRYGAHPAGPADERFFTLCNLAVRRDAMIPFDHELLCAEENDLLSRMSDAGVTMHYDPELVAYHERRATMRGFVRQMHKYGRGRGQLLVRRPRTARPAHLAPSALVVYAVASPAAATLAGPVVFAPLLAYGAAVGVMSAWIARTLQRPWEVPRAAALLTLLHVAYGTGVLRGAITDREPVPEPVARSWIDLTAEEERETVDVDLVAIEQEEAVGDAT